jgi:hypothetical protein
VDLQAGRTPPGATPPGFSGSGDGAAARPADVAGMLEKDEWDLFCSRIHAGLLAQRRGDPLPATPAAERPVEEDDSELVVEGDILEAEDLLIEGVDGVPVADDAIVDEQPSGLHPMPTRPEDSGRPGPGHG